MREEHGFWVIEDMGRKGEFSWWFEVSPEDNIDELAERLERAARVARAFWKELPPTGEEREIYLKLVRAVRSQRIKILLLDLL